MQGFAELEYGMLRYMGAIDDSTPVVTSGCVTTLLLFYCVVSHSFHYFQQQYVVLHNLTGVKFQYLISKYSLLST